MNEFFSEEKAKEMLNKTVLVQARILNKENELIKREEYIGVIVKIDAEKGIFIKAPSGKINWFPPNTKAFNIAPNAKYKDLKTGNFVEKPDYLLKFEMKIEKVKKSGESDKDDLSTTIVQ